MARDERRQAILNSMIDATEDPALCQPRDTPEERKRYQTWVGFGADVPEALRWKLTDRYDIRVHDQDTGGDIYVALREYQRRKAGKRSISHSTRCRNAVQRGSVAATATGLGLSPEDVPRLRKVLNGRRSRGPTISSSHARRH